MNANTENRSIQLAQALDPESIKVDGRNNRDRLAFVAAYSNLILYYDQKNQLAGDWQAFFMKDPTILLAAISKTDYAHYHSEFMLLESSKAKSPAFVNQLCQLLQKMFATINQWFRFMELNAGTSTLYVFLKQQIEETLAGQLSFMAALQRRMFDMTKGAIAAPDATFFQTLEPIWTKTKNRQHDLSFSEQAESSKIAPLVDDLRGIYHIVFDVFMQVIEYATQAFYQLENQPTRYPDTALLMAFSRLMETQQSEINQYGNKHLNFYYDRILQQNLRPAQPDHVFACLKLADKAAPLSLPAGTLFKAGIYPDQSEILFSNNAETEINQAVISLVNTLYYDQSKSDAKVLYLNTIAKPDQVTRNQLQEIVSWDGFGEATGPEIKQGFALASPMLLLQGGLRTITIDFTFTSSSAITFLSNIQCYLSTAKGWFAVPSTSPAPEKSSNTIQIILPADDPAIVAFKKNPDGYTSAWPMLKIMLDKSVDLTAPPSLTQVSIDVDVDGYEQFSMANDISPLPNKGPQPILGPIPELGDSFYVGSNECFAKPLSSLTLTMNWDNLPDDLSEYYGAYNQYLFALQITTITTLATTASTAVIAAATELTTANEVITTATADAITAVKIASAEATASAKLATAAASTAAAATAAEKDAIAAAKAAMGTPQEAAAAEAAKAAITAAADAIASETAASKAAKAAQTAMIVAKAAALVAQKAASAIAVAVTDASSAKTAATKAEAAVKLIEKADSAEKAAAIASAINAVNLAEKTATSAAASAATAAATAVGTPAATETAAAAAAWVSAKAATTATATASAVVFNNSAFTGTWQSLNQTDPLLSNTSLFQPDKKGASNKQSSTFSLPVKSIVPAIPDLALSPLPAIGKATNGYVYFELKTPEYAFGNSLYPKVVSYVTFENAQLLIKHASDPDPVTPLPLPMPNLPYIPKLSSLTGHYKASAPTKISSKTSASYPLEIYHYGSFKPYLAYDSTKTKPAYGFTNLTPKGLGTASKSLPLFPGVSGQGCLYASLSGVVAPCRLSLFFEISAKNVATPDKGAGYYYWTSTGWQPITVLKDETNNLNCSGIVKFEIPQVKQDEISLPYLPSPIMPNTDFWLAIATKVDGIKLKLSYLNTQAVKLTRVSTAALPLGETPQINENIIAATQNKMPQIAGITQPFASFGGLPAESKDSYGDFNSFYRRVSERLSNKDRCVSSADFVDMAHASCINLYYAKTLSDKPGSVRLGLVNGYANAQLPNAFRPVVDSIDLAAIRKHIESRTSAMTRLSVVNMKLHPVTIDVKLVVASLANAKEIKKALNQQLKVYLSPWICSNLPQRSLTQQDINRAAIITFLTTQNNVISVTNLSIKNERQLNEDTILVSATQHDIKLVMQTEASHE